MRAISASELLHIWDRGVYSGPLARSLDLLAAAYPELSQEELAREPVGARDSRLLAVRGALFGEAVAGTAFCPECGERSDLNFSVHDLEVPAPQAEARELSLELDEYRIAFRLPCTIDLATAPAGEGIEGVRAHLLACCLTEIVRGGEAIPESGMREAVAAIPEKAIGHLLGAMAAADPQADLQLDVLCPACRHRWSIIFDVLSFLWSEIDGWAGRFMREVYTLSRAYGWNESEILALSPHRRRVYLEIATQ